MKTRWQVWTKEPYGNWIKSGKVCKDALEASLQVKILGKTLPQLKAIALLEGEHPEVKGY